MKRLAARCFAGAAGGALTGTLVGLGVMFISSSFPSGPNAMAGMFIAQAMLVILVVNVATASIMGMLGVFCSDRILFLVAAILIGLFLLLLRGDPVAADFLPQSIAAILGGAWAGRKARAFFVDPRVMFKIR
jgi:hypothetical protein